MLLDTPACLGSHNFRVPECSMGFKFASKALWYLPTLINTAESF